MRTLTTTLLAAQKTASRKPYLRVEARNTHLGVVNLKWTRLYSGAEEENQHALTLPGDGSLVRVRIAPVSDGLKLYRQRVADPGPESDYSQWTDMSQYNIKGAAVCSVAAEVSLVWARSNGEIRRQKSTDCGDTWEATEYPGYAPSASVNSLTAFYKPNGDLAIFFTDADTLYLIKCLSGEWQAREAWDKSTGELTGVAAVYADGDWKLIVTGQDLDGNYKAWSLVYGDGGEAAAGAWTDLKTLASAPSDGAYEYTRLFLDNYSQAGMPAPPDEFRLSFLEKFSGNEAYELPFFSHNLPGTYFLESRWKEPYPFPVGSLESGGGSAGIALGHYGDYAWAGCAAGVWRACTLEETLDLSGEVMGAKLDLEQDKGEAMLVLDNSSGIYSGIPGTILASGNELLISPGYRGSAGDECSEGLYFVVQGYEHTNLGSREKGEGSRVGLILYASDGWEALGKWTARSQFRWNQPDGYGAPVEEASVKEILAQVLAKAGLRLETLSESAVVTGYYPDFTIHAGDDGKSSIRKLLTLAPDVIFIEGNTAYLVNPLAEDEAVYAYYSQAGTPVPPPVPPTGHVILEGRYRSNAWKVNRIRVEGLDPDTGEPVIAERFAWDDIKKNYDRLLMIEDRNIHTAEEAEGRGAAALREAEMEATAGFIRIPVNCGQQLYDVIEITDGRAGLAAVLRRVVGISLSYIPRKAVYEQRLELGGV